MRLYLEVLWAALRARIEALRREPEAGYTTEAVLVTALLVLIALAALAIIAAKVAAKAENIDLGLTPW